MKELFVRLCLWGFALSGFHSGQVLAQPFMIESPAFDDQGFLPQRYTCMGSSISPPLRWSNAPPGTQSFVLILTDLDAPYGMNRTNTRAFHHWGIFNMPAGIRSLPENADDHLPDAVSEAMNDAENRDYSPPCPPEGRHRYVFTLYALDRIYRNDQIESVGRLRAALENPASPDAGHVLGKARLTAIAGP